MNLCVAEKAVLPKIEAETEAKTMQHGKMQTSSHYMMAMSALDLIDLPRVQICS